MRDCSTFQRFLKEFDRFVYCLHNKTFHTNILWTERTCSLYKIRLTTIPSVYMEDSIHTYKYVTIIYNVRIIGIFYCIVICITIRNVSNTHNWHAFAFAIE